MIFTGISLICCILCDAFAFAFTFTPFSKYVYREPVYSSGNQQLCCTCPYSINFRNGLLKNSQQMYNILVLTVTVNTENVYE